MANPNWTEDLKDVIDFHRCLLQVQHKQAGAALIFAALGKGLLQDRKAADITPEDVRLLLAKTTNLASTSEASALRMSLTTLLVMHKEDRPACVQQQPIQVDKEVHLTFGTTIFHISSAYVRWETPGKAMECGCFDRTDPSHVCYKDDQLIIEIPHMGTLEFKLHDGETVEDIKKLVWTLKMGPEYC